MSFEFKVDDRDLKYGRLASGILAMLRGAVDHRVSQGESKASIANRIGRDRSSLSRILNGRVPNLTLRTISDILTATDHTPGEWEAAPDEQLSPNHVPMSMTGADTVSSSIGAVSTWLPAVNASKATIATSRHFESVYG